MARVYSSNAGFRHPGMHGAMGLFGSQARPGMRAGTTNLGSLGGGSVLGTDQAIDDMTINAPAPVATAPAPAPAPVPAGMSTQTKLLLAGGVVAAYYLFFRK